MRLQRLVVPSLAVGLLLIATLATAQVPAAPVPTPPPTIWNFLGIPQGIHKVNDAIVNAAGNHPALERKPPLKKIADPANLQSPNPAVKKAAEIKQDEDLAPQKIKAIKYLAKVGCGCHPGVREALLAALDDCTEAVRFQAAMAFCEAAGNPCKTCDRGSCCSAEVQKKLKEVAFGRDANGCWKEPSCRVRVAAENALNACQAVMPEPVQPVPEPRPEPIQPQPERTAPTGPQPAEGANAGGLVRPVGMEQVAPGGMPLGAASPSASIASPSASEGWVMVSEHGRLLRRCRPCPPGQTPGPAETPAEPSLAPQPGVAPGQGALPGEVTPFTAEAVEPSALASSIGAVSGPRSVAPAMIGDFFGGGLYQLTDDQGNIGIAGGDRLFKVGENNSPMPTDRVFFNYNHFNNAAQTIDGNLVDFDRFAFGLEKTFLDGCASVEFRIPFGSGLNADQSLDQGAGLTGTEFGNIPIVTKLLLIQRECNAVSAGMALVLPTARDARLLSGGRTELLVQNESVHMDPYLAWLWTPNDRWFTQTFLQFDFATSGNPVVVQTLNNGMARAGVLQDQSLMIVDFKVGYWLYQNPCARFLTGVAPTVELHYTTTMQNADQVPGLANRVPGIVNDFNRWDNLNLTAGLHFALGECSTLTVFGVAPLKSDRSASRLSSSFDGEVGLQLVRRF